MILSGGFVREHRAGKSGQLCEVTHTDLIWNFRTMFPSPQPLVNQHNLICDTILISPLATAGFEDKIGSGFLAERVVSEERKDARPLRHDRLPFAALPAIKNLT
jgi:hypothetical protein